MQDFVTIEWKAKLTSGSELVNPDKKDRNAIWCSGITKVRANNAKEAITHWKIAFPYDRVKIVS